MKTIITKMPADTAGLGRVRNWVKVTLNLVLLMAVASEAMAGTEVKLPLRQAAISMPDGYSAQVAKSILLKGGNAVDAAVAAGFVLAVTYPEAGNLGGGGFMTLFNPSVGSSTEESVTSTQSSMAFLDYRETAPQAAFTHLYLDKEQKVIPNKSLVGYQASGVPGSVMGFWMAHQRYGSLEWSALLQPAIDYAKNGFVVSQNLAKTRRWYEGWIANKSPVPLNFKAYFGGLKTGVVFKQPELAQTLQRIADKGAGDFYQGETAHLIVQQMQRHDGLITLEDLKGYQAVWRTPILGSWKGRQIISAPPPSSGGIAIVQLLKMKALLDASLLKRLKQGARQGLSEQAIKTHFYAELEKRVYADRAFYLGDTDFVEVPIKTLISDHYLQRRSQSVLLDEISHSETMTPGKLESPETTHFSILDGYGNAVSNTYTLNMPFGSGVVVEGAGFLMNDEMDDFSTKPGVANVFGVVGGKANEIAPGKRMLSSMSPTIILKDGAVEMVVGTPGGSTIITSVFQTIVNVVEEGMSAQQAVDAPRVHHQLLPKNLIVYHPDLPESTKDELSLMGYRLQKNNYMGDVQLILHQHNTLSAASDYRGRGVSEVFSLEESNQP